MQNDMKDRLVELLKEASYYLDEQDVVCNRVADHLIENDVIVLPCKINDTVYCIATVHDALHPTFSWGCCEKYRIVKCTCKSIDVHLPINPVDTEYNPQIYCTDKTDDHKSTDFHFLLKPEDFGTEAFLSEEEARQMLYDMPEVKCGEWIVCGCSAYCMCVRKEDGKNDN